MITRRSLASMSANDGVVLVRYHGERARCSATSLGSWPASAYQMISSVMHRNWKGTGRSTALGARVARIADARQFFAFLVGGLCRPALGVAFAQLRGARVEVGGDELQLIALAL